MESIWSQTCQIEECPPLTGDTETDVAVIGAGMAGVLIASALQEAGKRVVVLETDRIASGQTRNTTAKITSQHGSIYRKMTDSLGEDKARQYAMVNEAALEEYRRVIAARSIDCDFEDACAYVYGDDAEALRAEAECAAALDLPASFTGKTVLPFPIAGAVCFEHQAQFHPLKFLSAMAAPLTIYEHTRVKDVAEESGQAVKGLARRFFQIPAETAKKLSPGHGGIVFLDGEKVGVYKDKGGTIHPVDIQCPHLGCQLEWNPDEKSWDCPCHGSRFDRYGSLISGPTQTDIHAET